MHRLTLILLLAFLIWPVQPHLRAQTRFLQDMELGGTIGRLTHVGSERRLGYHIGFTSHVELGPVSEDPTRADINLTVMTRLSRHNYHLSSDESAAMGTTFIDIGAGPKLSLDAIDLMVIPFIAIPIANSAESLNPSRLDADDFDSPYAGLLARMWLNAQARLAFGGEFAVITSPYYRDDIGSSYPGGMFPGGSTFASNLRWLGLNVRYRIRS
ncbi:MAG: hypothetical protein WA952_17860 [Lewinella sp.]